MACQAGILDVPARAFYEFVGSVHPAIGPSGTLEYDVVVEIKPCHGVLTVDDVCHADKTPSLGNSELGRCVRTLAVSASGVPSGHKGPIQRH